MRILHASQRPSIVVPEAKVWHKVSVSLGGEGSPLQTYFVTRNRLRWTRLHGSASQRRAAWRATLGSLRARLSPFLAGGGGLRARWWALREAVANPLNRAMLLGLYDYLRGRFGDCPPVVREWTQRAREQGAARRTSAVTSGVGEAASR